MATTTTTGVPIDVVMSMMPATGITPGTLTSTLSSRTRRNDVSPPPAYTDDGVADIYVIKSMRSPCL